MLTLTVFACCLGCFWLGWFACRTRWRIAARFWMQTYNGVARNYAIAMEEATAYRRRWERAVEQLRKRKEADREGD